MIYIIGSEYNATHDALEIYVSGCKRRCPYCHNREAQEFGKGKRWPLWLKENAYKLKTGTFSRVWILGGDLTAQPVPEALELLRDLHRAMPGHMELWLWTGAELADVHPQMRTYFDIIKTGAYNCDLLAHEADVYGDGKERIILASSNQRFHNMMENERENPNTLAPYQEFRSLAPGHAARQLLAELEVYATSKGVASELV